MYYRMFRSIIGPTLCQFTSFSVISLDIANCILGGGAKFPPIDSYGTRPIKSGFLGVGPDIL